MPVPVGINKDTDASLEPRQGRISTFLLAPLPGKRKSRKKQTNPKGSIKTKSSPVQIQKSKAIHIIINCKL